MTSTHSIYKEFDNEIKTLISTYANNNPAPRFAKIINISPDENYVDVNLGDGTLKAVERFGGKPVLNRKCILVFMNGNYDTPVAICSSYNGSVPPYNLLNNGRFQRLDDEEHFENWTGGIVSTKNYWYDKSTARLLPNTSMVSDPIDITSLEDKSFGETSEIMLFYFYLGEIEIEIIDTETNQPVLIAPESLGNTKEILEPVDEWFYARTHFLLRDHKTVQIKFINSSQTESAYIDGVRLWSPDFDMWYPSENDKE